MAYRLTSSPLTAVLNRLLLFAVVWLILAGGAAESWIFGVPAILVATWASLALRPVPGPWLRWRGLARFIPFFLWGSLRGGLDVALRVMGPRLRIDPGFHRFRLRLRGRAARVVFLDTLSLLPGTLSAELTEEDALLVHVIDRQVDLGPRLLELEQRVGALFGEQPA